ncbi:hypothetical protein Tco_1402390 [Tanacetum coccineum]
MEESLSKFMSESAKRHEGNSNLIKEIRASTNAAIRNQEASIKTLEIQIGQMSKVLQEKGFGSLHGSIEINLRDHVKDSMLFFVPNQTTIPFLSRLYHYDEEKGSYGLKDKDACGTTLRNDALSQKEKDPVSFTLPCYINNICFEKSLANLGASVSVMPFSTYTNLGLGELAHTKLIIELADRTVKHPKGIAENILVGIGDEKIIFKSVKPASSLIKRVYMLSLREILELDLEAILIGETLILNRSLDHLNGDSIELNDLNEPLELRRNQADDLEPTIEEGEVDDEPMEDIDKARYNEEIIGGLDEYPSYCDFDRKIHIDCDYNPKFSCMIGYEYVDANFFPFLFINVMSKSFFNLKMKDKMEFKGKNIVGTFINMRIFVGNFSVMTNFLVVEDMDNYRDDGMGNVIVGKPFCREVCVTTKQFEGIITIVNGNDCMTYQMVQSHPRFKHLTNEQCNKILPLLEINEQVKMNGISNSYQKLKGLYKGFLDLGPEFIRDEKIVERLIRKHISVHEME